MSSNQQTRSPPAHVVVIGAGIVGVCCAIELLRLGYRVTIIESHTVGGEHAASYGNGAWISPASIVPMSSPGLWKKIPGYLLDKRSPLTIDWRALPELFAWLLRFLWAGRSFKQLAQTARALNALLHDAPNRHAELARLAGVPDAIAQKGLLYVYPNKADFLAQANEWQLRRSLGLVWEELETTALHQRAPSLSAHYTFGVYVASASHCTNPAAYLCALHRYATEQGAIAVQATASCFCFDEKAFIGVRIEREGVSQLLSCEHIVIAAGIAAKSLALQAGDQVCMVSERGYHVELPHANIDLAIPVMPSDGKMANTLLTTGLRAAGQVELTYHNAPPNWARCDVLLAHLKRCYGELNTLGLRQWMGNRPSTPTGLPLIQYSKRCKHIVYAFGHGHIGLASAPATAQRVGGLLAALKND